MLVALAAVAGCAEEPLARRVSDAAPTPAPFTNPLALYPASRGGVHGRLAGRLELIDGCLYVVDGRGNRRMPIFRSPGSEWDPVNRAVSYDGRWLGIGDEVALGGGEISITRDTGRWVKPPPAPCDLSEAWLVTQGVDF